MDPVRRPPSWLLALGPDDPPAWIEVDGRRLERTRLYKHDFFAATARYGPPDAGAVILKLARRAPLFGLPLGWLGRLMTRHEARSLEAMQGLAVVPRALGRYGPHGLLRQYVEGHDLRRGAPVPDDFFPRLEDGLRAMHARRFAYVDLEKPENVLCGADGRPYLVDFQIAWSFRRCPWPFTLFRRWLQEADRYHAKKLQRRLRPDQMSAAELERSRRRPAHVRLFGNLSHPFRRLRRAILRRCAPIPKGTERGRVV
jgi:predicted Ser/Thr protein kinase